MTSESEPILPVEPNVRHITPAPEDFEGGAPPSHFAWPLAWTLAAALLVGVLLSQAWPVFGH